MYTCACIQRGRFSTWAALDSSAKQSICIAECPVPARAGLEIRRSPDVVYFFAAQKKNCVTKLEFMQMNFFFKLLKLCYLESRKILRIMKKIFNFPCDSFVPKSCPALYKNNENCLERKNVSGRP